MKKINEYPNGAEFAIAILDDTDDATIQNVKPVYDLLKEVGVRSTKTVWTFDTSPDNRGPYFAGETLSSSEYLEWVRELAVDGFEIAFHNATMGSSTREDTIHALDLLEHEFKKPIRLHCNHGQNRENLYWGVDRYSTSFLKLSIKLAALFRPLPIFDGDKPGSPYYWSDIAFKRLSYMRRFAFKCLNGEHIPPGGLYRDPAIKEAPLFFNSTDAPYCRAFNMLVNPISIDELRKQHGWAIVSTHFAKDFYSNNRIDPEFKKTMEYLKKLPGWYVPVSELLDFIRAEKGIAILSHLQRAKMELLHVLDRLQGKYP